MNEKTFKYVKTVKATQVKREKSTTKTPQSDHNLTIQT